VVALIVLDDVSDSDAEARDHPHTNHLALPPSCRVSFHDVPGLAVLSSTQARATTDGRFLRAALDPKVLAYIRRNR
jgi:hypothetical protein